MAERTCVGCRTVREKKDLVRFVAADGVLTADPGGVMPGRGAYLCRDENCLKEACRKKDSFSRALRCKVIVPEAEVLWLKIKGRIQV